MEAIQKTAERLGCTVIRNEPLSRHTTFKTGGAAALFIEVRNERQLAELIPLIKEKNVEFFLLGNGSNVLAPDEGYGGTVLTLGGDFKKISRSDDGAVFCAAGASLTKLCLYAAENGLSGLEFAWGIPATVGGAVYMNAGAYGSEIKNVLCSCRYMRYDGEICVAYRDGLRLSYRHSIFCDEPAVILGADFKLSSANKADIRAQMEENMRRRKEKQPLEYPSAGSTFKRPQGHFAGALIERCGLKGMSVGGAQVSEKHAGFIINKNGATADDVKLLIEKVQKTVSAQTGVDLKREVIYM